MHHGEGECGIAAGMKLQMQIRRFRCRVAHGIDNDHRTGRLGQPMAMGMRRAGGRIGAPYDDAFAVFDGPRIEAVHGSSEHIAERHMAGHVAHRIGLHLARPKPAEEAHGKIVGD